MKKQLLLLAFLAISLSVAAQKEYKLAKSSGKLNLNISGVTLVGYSGNEIIFSAKTTEPEDVNERAKGLKPINSSGFKDNTGLGLDVTVKGDEINVNPVSVSNQNMVTIKVPQNIKVFFANNSSMYQDSIILKNLKNEIEVSVSYNEVKLENNTGPMNIKTLYGSVDAVFQNEIKGPVSIVSVYGHVDVALPVGVKANLDAGTSYGKIYAAEGLKIAVEKRTEQTVNTVYTRNSTKTVVVGAVPPTPPSALTLSLSSKGQQPAQTVNYSFGSESENIKGKINGGGVDLILKSSHDNIYIREK